MKILKALIILYSITQIFSKHHERLNGPIVGILTLPTPLSNQTYPQDSFSMIPSSYVKWLEQTGIRIIPLRYDMPNKILREMMGLINGILITGGSTSFFKNKSKICEFKRLLDPNILCPSLYMTKIDFIVKQAKKMSDRGNPFPIWGICLGFEGILISLSKYTLLRKPLSDVNHSLNLKVMHNYDHFFNKFFGKTLKRNIETKPLAFFNHKYAITPSLISQNNFLRKNINILTTSEISGEEFVTMIKHKKYPFMGTQFHPEKIQYEHRSTLQTNASFAGIEFSHKLAMLFFEEVSKNQNEMDNQNQLEALLIFNYPLYKTSSNFEQIYIFPRVFEMKIKKKRLFLKKMRRKRKRRLGNVI